MIDEGRQKKASQDMVGYTSSSGIRGSEQLMLTQSRDGETNKSINETHKVVLKEWNLARAERMHPDAVSNLFLAPL
jgi:hypothetical protein